MCSSSFAVPTSTSSPSPFQAHPFWLVKELCSVTLSVDLHEIFITGFSKCHLHHVSFPGHNPIEAGASCTYYFLRGHGGGGGGGDTVG